MHQLKSQSRSAGLQFKRLSRPSEFGKGRALTHEVNTSIQDSRESCSMSAKIVERGSVEVEKYCWVDKVGHLVWTTREPLACIWMYLKSVDVSGKP